MENFNYFTKKREIEFLVKHGWDIVEIIENEDISHFFLSMEFEPPVHGSVHSTPFVQITGRDISKFLKENIYNQCDIEYFKQKINEFNTKNKNILYKFSDNHKWRFYTQL